MLPDFESVRSAKAWRAIYVICTLLVLSYLLFEVLDLDGSDFPLKRSALEHAAIVADVAKDSPDVYPLGKTGLWWHRSTLSPGMLGPATWVRLAQAFNSAPLIATRIRGYRTGLPRSSIPDHLPYA